MTVTMSSDNLDKDRCPKCGIAMTDRTDHRAKNAQLRSVLAGVLNCIGNLEVDRFQYEQIKAARVALEQSAL